MGLEPSALFTLLASILASLGFCIISSRGLLVWRDVGVLLLLFCILVPFPMLFRHTCARGCSSVFIYQILAAPRYPLASSRNSPSDWAHRFYSRISTKRFFLMLGREYNLCLKMASPPTTAHPVT